MRCAAWIAGLALALGTAGAEAQTVKTIAEYPTGNFLENLEPQPDGRILFTSYFAKTIGTVDAQGRSGPVFAGTSAHPVSITSIDGGYLVTAHGKPFVSGPDFVKTQRILLLDKDGKETGAFDAPEALFLNGSLRLSDGRVLVADSIAATIWVVDPARRTIARWLQDPALSQDPAQTRFAPGANGLKWRDEMLLISNSSRGTLSAVAVTADGRPGGAITAVAATGGIDDFAVAENGDVVFTTHGDALKKLSRGGAISTILATGCDACTSVALVRRAGGPAAVVLTTGGLAEGRRDPARVLEVTLP